MHPIKIYEVMSKPDNNAKIPAKLDQILQSETVGSRFTISEIIDKYAATIFSNYKTRQVTYNAISNFLPIAKKAGLIKTIQERDMPEWFESLETVKYWQRQLRGSRLKHEKGKSSTNKQYLYHLWVFNKWLSKNEFQIDTIKQLSNNTFTQKKTSKKFDNVEELLKELEHPLAVQKNVVKIIKYYLLDDIHKNKKASSVKIIRNAIKSYFEKNEQPLNITFNPYTIYSNTTEYEQSISLSELMSFLTTGKPSVVEKAVFLCKFQRGLDVSTLVDRFNYEAWEQIVKWFGSEKYDSWDLEKCPVPISLIRVKTDFRHVGFIDRDAISEIQKYLDYRKTKTDENMQTGQALFLNKFGRPITNSWLFGSFSRIAKRAEIHKFVEANGRKYYNMDSHELRDLLKSTLIDSGCKQYVADHVIGHMPKDSYEKQAKLYPETLRKEYAKASKRLNIFTKFTSVVNGTDDADELRISLKDKLDELEKIKQRSLDDEAEKIRNDKMAEQNARQMSQMMDMINELKTQINSTKNNKSDELEFCCIKCSTIHKNQKCPVCDSKLKRIYE